MNGAPSISVLIRSFNSGKTLDRVLSGMPRASGDEFIVVDSGSTDATVAIAQKHNSRVIFAPAPFNYSRSLNLGFQFARNPWVVVLSSHCIPIVPDLLEAYRNAVVKFAPDVVVGYAPSTLSGKSEPGLDPTNTTYYGQAEYPQVARVCGNGNTIYRRTAWEELPFDENVRTAEDKIWIMEMIRRNYRFAYIPTAGGLNQSQASLLYMFRKGYRDARALRPADHRPMKLRHLAGALKNLTLPKLRGEIGWQNWTRYGAHTFGQFFGSYRREDNTPIDGAS